MSLTISQLLASSFAWTTGGTDAVVTTGAAHNVSIASGTYRVLLGTGAATGGTAEPLADWLQVVQARLSAAATPATFSVTMSATTGYVTIARTDGTGADTFTLTGTTLLKTLGFTANISIAVRTATGIYRPPHCIFVASVTNEGYSPRTPGAYETTAGGQSYGYTSAVTSWPVTLAFDFIPRNYTVAVNDGDAVTPQRSAPGVLLTHAAPPWSWEDSLLAGAGGMWAITTADFPFATVAASTANGAIFAKLSLDPAAYTDPGFKLRDPSWPKYVRVTIPAVQRADSPWGSRS